MLSFKLAVQGWSKARVRALSYDDGLPSGMFGLSTLIVCFGIVYALSSGIESRNVKNHCRTTSEVAESKRLNGVQEGQRNVDCGGGSFTSSFTARPPMCCPSSPLLFFPPTSPQP